MIRSNLNPARPLFGAANPGARSGMVNASTDRPVSDVWLNVGYETGDDKYPIVSLPFGIPIDTQEPLKLSGRDHDFLAFTGARNELLKQIQDLAADLKPGEDVILNPGSGLVIQLRRRNSESEAPAAEGNRFIRPLFAVESADNGVAGDAAEG